MRASVRAIFIVPFTEGFEGGVPCLYNDVRGKTTIAFGNLCNMPGDAAALPLMHPGGIPATTAQKIAAWHRVHDDPGGAQGGWRHSAKLTDLRLTREAMTALAMRRADANNAILIQRLPDFEDFNACAQLALHSWAWAGGAADPYPHMFAALLERDFAVAAVEIFMKEVTPEGIRNTGLVPRNVANRILMKNAARVDAFKLNPDMIEWRIDLTVSEEDTLPSLTNPPSIPPSTGGTVYVATPRRDVTGSGGTSHPFPDEPPPDDDA